VTREKEINTGTAYRKPHVGCFHLRTSSLFNEHQHTCKFPRRRPIPGAQILKQFRI